MRRVAALALLATLVAAPQAAATSKTLTLGFFDPQYVSFDYNRQAAWLDSSRTARADVVRIGAEWSTIAPKQRPSGFHAADPADPHYDWRPLDDAVRFAAARGLRPLVTVARAPRWAEDGKRANDAPAGSWRPKSGELAKFVTAAARRYSGHFPDPADKRRRLPYVRRWQIWNEPNLTTWLAPQYVRRHGRYRLASPSRFRALLNAAYKAIKGVDRHAVVVAAGTAPYGDRTPGSDRTPPALFVRELLCLRGRELKTQPCKHPAHLDALAHHPYSIGAPQRKASNPDDVAIPDLGKLKRPLRKAEKTHRVLPKGHRPLWVTEVSWDSKPPDPDGVPEKRHARWLAEAFQLLWKQGVTTICWFQVRDAPPVPSYASSYQSGVFFLGGKPKLAVRAYRFPFTASSSDHRVSLWVRAPAKGKLRIQFKSGKKWRTISELKAGRRGAVLTKRLHSRGRGQMRAVQGKRVSLPGGVR